MLTRRHFLSTLGAGAAALALPACGEPPVSKTSRPRRIVVIVAGLSGLAAAIRMQERGHDVTVLEARDRIGGRVWTLRGRYPENLHVEAGAQWFPEGHRTLRSWLTRFNLAAEPSRNAEDLDRLTYRWFIRETAIDQVPGQEGYLCSKNGEPTGFPLHYNALEFRLGRHGMRRKYVVDAAAEIGDPTQPDWPAQDVWRFDGMNLTQLMKARGASDEAIAFLRLGLYDDWGDGCDHVSALCVLRDLKLLGDKAMPILGGGSDRLPLAMAGVLEEEVRLSAPVVRVTHDESGATVTAVEGGGTKEHRADAVICTVPLSTLENIEFTPALAPAHAAAAEELSYTSIVRTFMHMKERFWLKDGRWGDSITDLPMQALIHSTMNQSGRAGVLCAYTAAAQARRLGRMAPEDRYEEVLSQTERVHPGARDHFVAGHTVDWDAEPWSKGAFVWFRPGQMQEHMRHVGRPQGRLFFAGEHASPCPGWMEGALLSAERVAREVASSI